MKLLLFFRSGVPKKGYRENSIYNFRRIYITPHGDEHNPINKNRYISETNEGKFERFLHEITLFILKQFERKNLTIWSL